MSDYPSWIFVREFGHRSLTFPEDTDETVTFVAGSPANTFSAWTEIVDNNGVTLSSKLVNRNGHISATPIESIDKADRVFKFEIAYGAAKTVVSEYRFATGATTKLPTIQHIRVRPEDIPEGETVYYRMKCSEAGKSCTISLRYHYR